VYTVKLTVTDAAGASASTTQQVTVLDEPPTAAFSMTPVVPTPSGPVAFDARASSEPDGAIASYTWDFGDGATGAGATPTHAYVNAGTYAVRLTVVDGAGQRATVTHPVTVYSLPQSTFAYAPSLPVEGTATTFTAGPTTAISSCAWSFGDGGTAYGATVTHTYAHKGGYRVTLTVTSVFGLTTSTAEVVTVADAPPTPVIAVLSARPAPRHPVAFSGARSYDGDPIVSYLWRFGDRSGAVGRRLTHRYARAGTYRVSLTVRDSYGETATTSTTVAVGSTARDKPRRSHRRGRQR
jgi:PKD repeat protein